MLELDHIAVDFRDDPGDPVQLTRLVGEKHRNRKDPVSHNESLLHHARHGDDVHIAAAEDGDDFFAPAVDMLEGRDAQKA